MNHYDILKRNTNGGHRLMKFKLIAIVIYIICILFGHDVYGQMGTICSELPKVKWGALKQNTQLTVQQKIERLSLMPKDDSVQFELPEYDAEQYPDDPRYFALDTAGLHYIDLDFDGDLDLLYSGQSGWQNLKDTKVLINDNNRYQLHKVISGRIIDLHQEKDHYKISTLWIPCCDSYTSKIEIHNFANKALTRTESISMIGIFRLDGMPDFDNLKPGYIENAALYASQDDFKGTSPYFRSDTNILRDSLRAGHPIQLIKLTRRIKVGLINQKKILEQKWYLVITEALTDAPPSRYEWSSGHKRRFIGWVKEIYLD